MQKTLVKVMHRKIGFVKVESSVIEISKSVHHDKTWIQMFYFLIITFQSHDCFEEYVFFIITYITYLNALKLK